MEIAEDNRIEEFGRAVYIYARRVLDDLDAQRLTSQQADDLFMLIDLYVGERDIEDKLPVGLQRLIFKGLHLYHLGKKFGPDLHLMHELIDIGLA